MKRSFIKILAILMIIGFYWTGLLAVGDTFAYFNDTVTVSTSLSAGTLDLSLRSGQGNFVPPEIANDMGPGESAARDIYIKKEGSLPFQYNAHSESILGSCNLEFYDLLRLKVWYNWYDNIGKHMDLKYDGLLKDFDLKTDPDLQIPNSHSYYSNVFYGQDEHWFYFSITYPSGATELTGKQCQFKFVFEGWQINLPNFSSGFSDVEEIHSTLTDSVFVEEEPIINNSSIVINEFLPIAGNYPEFIEFYNKGDAQLDVANWIIKNEDTAIIINSNILYGDATSTIIEPGKWLVVDLSKTGGDILDNTSDIIILYDSENNEIDTISYVEASIVDKSYARIPDGIGAWVDPIPTPGMANKLNEELVEEPAKELVEEPISDKIEGPVIEEESIDTEATTTEVVSTTTEEISTITTATVDFILSPSTSTMIIETPVEESISTTTITELPAEESDFIATTTTTIIPEATTTATTIPPITEEVSSEEIPVIDEPLVIEETSVDETLVIEQTPVVEEQPVIVPVDNNSVEQVSPVDISISGGDSSGSEVAVSAGESSGANETVSAAPSDGTTE